MRFVVRLLLTFGIAVMVGCTGTREVLVIRDVTVIDGTGADPQAGMTVVVEKERIKTLGAHDTVQYPRTARVVDAAGQYLIPGLWDMHVHLRDLEGTLPLFVVNGVTTVRDMGSVLEETVALRASVEAGTLTGPRILTAGMAVESASWMEQYLDLMRKRGADENEVEAFARTRIIVGDTKEAESAVDSLLARGADFIKIRHAESPEVFSALSSAAKAAGTHIAGHYVWILGLDEVARLGQRTIEHNVLPGFNGRTPEQKTVIFEALERGDTHLVPTLVTNRAETSPMDSVRALAHDSAGAIDSRNRYVSRGIRRSWIEAVELNARDVERPSPEVIRKMMAESNEFLLEAKRAGVPVLAGTDVPSAGTFFGFSLHDELVLLVETFDMTPMAALRSATAVPAAFVGQDAHLGTIEVGKRADLVLLDADPLADIANTRSIDAVISGGRLFNRTEREEILTSIATSIAAADGVQRDATPTKEQR
jgi:imidazolonepropionase-like amidohydrolase